MNRTVIPRPEYPNPIFERENWENLNGKWLFEIDSGNSGEDRHMFAVNSEDKYTKEITVPFCPESKLSGIEHKDFMTSLWYKRKVSISEDRLKGRVMLHFGAVDYRATVYVNGKAVGEHKGGYTHFEFDITEKLTVGENDITLHAEDDQRRVNQPRGKQCPHYQSCLCDYTRTTGIWQTVWLEYLPKDYIKSARIFPDIENCAFDIELKLSKCGRVSASAEYEGRAVGSVTKNSYGDYVRLTLPLSEKHLWEVGQGRLYDLVFTLQTENGVDTVKSYGGLREIKLDGLTFRLNGKSVFQRTVLDQGFYPDGIYTAPTESDLEKDIDLSISLGFNGARPHQKIFEPRYLYHCDKKGYLVWGEHASWGLDPGADDAITVFLPEWAESIERDFNHPSIIGWCPFNEIWYWDGRGFDNFRTLTKEVYKATKALDPTRPVIDASGGFHVMTDIYDQHDYDQNPENFKKSYEGYNGSKESFRFLNEGKTVFVAGLPFFMSEFGGTKWVPEHKKSADEKDSWGYGNEPKTEEEFFSRYEGLVTALLDAPNIMGFCYTQLYDIEQEQNGLLTYEREKKFDDYSRIIAANKKKAAIED